MNTVCWALGSVLVLFGTVVCEDVQGFSRKIDILSKRFQIFESGVLNTLLRLEKDIASMKVDMGRTHVPGPEHVEGKRERGLTDGSHQLNNSTLDEFSNLMKLFRKAFMDEKRARHIEIDKVSETLGDVQTGHGKILAEAENISARVSMLEHSTSDIYQILSEDISDDKVALVGRVAELEWKQNKTTAELEELVKTAGYNIPSNLALGKPTWESSSLYTFVGPEAAVDGRRIADFFQYPCTHTSKVRNPWWMVDLETVTCISRVLILNRANNWGHRLRNVVVTVQETRNGTGSMCGQFTGPGRDGQWVNMWCLPVVTGRYLKIQILGYEFLTLCEVEVYSC